MSNEQINIAIAEACGWNPPPEGMGNMTHGGGKFMSSEEWRKSHLPNYCNDLNAMHEAVREVFTGSHMQLDYSRTLIFVIKKSSPICKSFFSDFDLATATARLHAETFLRILGKWEGAK
jgi:hypothetical protein